ncbi:MULTISPECIES: hypothetical protein [Halomonas]|uniref:DUF4190 domain-containing protein n=1 Tax=Halomonas halophila TaxID=29573 RepID=A0ABQ0U6X8_9GAMM|nr:MULTISPECIES: hypothetical protein [Halomonas]MDR5891085.1 hypothetical protein [Halomonas salina]WJY08421.1 hypothetical protein QWG60_05770 [Halomonas halophila]GEK74223.1 hypothetical protein HHA04nite_27670 [Halomonas halophila]
MEDVIGALLMLGVLVGVWFAVARQYRKKGYEGVIRHFIGGFCGLGAMLVFGLFVAANEVSESPSTDAESAEQVVTTSEPQRKSLAELRDEAQAESDIGVDVETFTRRFNETMTEMELPFRFQGEISELDDGLDYRIANDRLSRLFSISLHVKPYSDDIREIVFIGVGDRRKQTGVHIFLIAAAVFSATQPDWPDTTGVHTVFEMGKEFSEKGARVAQTIDGLEYHYRRSHVEGNRFSVEPID